MKLLRAKFQNFRMLRDLELEFSNKPEERLTVIRAANESGKTTILHALRWALYGDSALPKKGGVFRLHPIDWEANTDASVPIMVMVEFELTSSRLNSEITTHQKYRLTRSTTERVDSDSKRPPSTVTLYELNETGADPYDEPSSFIKEKLPQELRGVFFTDGDQALSFIEADATPATKRRRVESAIHSLLGLEVINSSINRVKKSNSEANKELKQLGGADELSQVAICIEQRELRIEKLETAIEDAKKQKDAYDEYYEQTKLKLLEALEKGNKQELKDNLERVLVEIKQLNKLLSTAREDHAQLFLSQSLAFDLLGPILKSTFEKLDELYDQGKIPNHTIPVLHNCLEAGICICGESLRPEQGSDENRRAHILKLIEESQQADDFQTIITRLYFDTGQRVKGPTSVNTWLEKYKQVSELRDDLRKQVKRKRQELRRIQQTLAELPNTDIQGLEVTLQHQKKQCERFLEKQTTAETELKHIRNEYKTLKKKRDSLIRRSEKYKRTRAKLTITDDVLMILESARKQIENEELQKVSDQMNSIFIEMIGADPEQGAIIQRAEIDRKFNILVYGPDDRSLNPDRDLNGASRRALTFAFILALTKVSEVEAPNVIDTPLGMTSGYIRRSILRTAIRESKQLILFLTHDEIHGCEDIIDDATSVVYTLTNPAHYPVMLVNDPGVYERKVLRCSCNHRNTCELCQRRLNS